MSTFSDLGIPADLIAALDKRGITEPFEIQRAAIADALAGRDVCGRAPTGSGKTLAFGLPMLVNLERAAPKRPRALILAPTRELAAEIERALSPLAAVRGRRLTTIYGGVGYEPQRKALRRGVDAVIVCPGRLIDLVDQGALRLSDVEFVVIDEADRMADMGFLPAVRKLLDMTATQRQTMMFSATLGRDVIRLVRDYQHDPVKHEVGAEGLTLSSVEHTFVRIERHDRVRASKQLLDSFGSAILFCKSRHGADRVAKQLTTSGISAVALHGGHTQNKRDRAIKDFKSGRATALVATDVAARGIHVEDLGCVIHFDLPEDETAYIHRSGRTGRAGARGNVVTLVARDTAKAARALQRALDLPEQLHDELPGDGTFVATRAPAAAPTAPSRNRPPRNDSRPNQGRKFDANARPRSNRNRNGNAGGSGNRNGNRKAS